MASVVQSPFRPPASLSRHEKARLSLPGAMAGLGANIHSICLGRRRSVERDRERKRQRKRKREREQSGVSHVRALMPGERESERNGYT